MKRTTRFATFALAASLAAGVVLAPVTASASEEGRRNTAIGLGAAAAALLLTQKNALPGILAAGGAAYAFEQAQDHGRRDNRHDFDRRDRDNRYNDRRDNDRRGNDRFNR